MGMKPCYIGLDGGSTYLKAAILRDGIVLDTMVRSTGIDNNGTAVKIVEELCMRNGVEKKRRGLYHGDRLQPQSTGYRRRRYL